MPRKSKRTDLFAIDDHDGGFESIRQKPHQYIPLQAKRGVWYVDANYAWYADE